MPGQEQCRWYAAGNPLEGSAGKVTHNRLTQLNGIRWRYDIHGRTVEKDNGQTRWHYCYDGEHRLTEVIRQPRDRNKPQTQVSFRYDPLGRRISKTRRQMLGGQPTGKPVCLGRVPLAAGGARGRAADLCLQRSGQLRSAGAY
ncbi:RHS repeat-associated core domain containing protein-containing protein [Enterobacter sp. J49]|nr:RHS repeat-associated core domain containing protein-containing protein [Enterobacter sp. J49]